MRAPNLNQITGKSRWITVLNMELT
ncbi:UNVERIFIED_CONTAM: hypothetical protein GTU68_066792 [Idotea baltica]|nr:hypothetical protein [Idotea baltica]